MPRRIPDEETRRKIAQFAEVRTISDAIFTLFHEGDVGVDEGHSALAFALGMSIGQTKLNNPEFDSLQHIKTCFDLVTEAYKLAIRGE